VSKVETWRGVGDDGVSEVEVRVDAREVEVWSSVARAMAARAGRRRSARDGGVSREEAQRGE
jgi:hypothetical protein